MADAQQPARPDQRDDAAPPVSAFTEAFGGWQGLLDSALPATAFVLVRLVTGGIAVPAAVAVAAGLAVVALRRARGQSQQQAWGGFFGLALAVAVASVTGTGEGFFLPGIATTALTGVAFVVSILVRRPAVALALTAYDAKWAAWRDHPPLRRACYQATAFWAVTFFIRSGVAWWRLSQPGDRPGELLVVINVVKWALIASAVAVTWLLVRRAGPPAQQLPAAAPAA